MFQFFGGNSGIKEWQLQAQFLSQKTEKMELKLVIVANVKMQVVV